MSGSWKVAYSDFMTAMMAFFLLMWILNMSPPGEPSAEEGQASGGTEVVLGMNEGEGVPVGGGIPGGVPGGKGAFGSWGTIQYRDKIDTREFNAENIQRSYYAIMTSLKGTFSRDAIPQAAGGVRYNDNGVLINLTNDLMFIPGTTTFNQEGEKVLDAVMDIMRNYDVYLVVRGYTDSSETGKPHYPSKWELSAAKATSAVEALIARGADPARMRAVAYADTNPLVPSTVPGAAVKNSRVEFNFHRPEVMSTIQSF